MIIASDRRSRARLAPLRPLTSRAQRRIVAIATEGARGLSLADWTERPGLRGRCCAWFERLCRIWLILANRRKTGDRCVYFPERVINRPDPCIYDQFLLMQLGRPVTWDNPDIAIFSNGVEQYTYGLTVDTIYDVVIQVHNSSAEKDAPGTQVAVRWVEFGAGGQSRHHIADLVADVPVWPGVREVHTQWRTPATPGHYCVEVELWHPNDGNPANNLGWNNTVVQTAASEVQFPFRVFNRWVDEQPPRLPAHERDDRRPPPWNLVELVFDSYVFTDAIGEEVDPDQMFAPRPPAWPARLEPQAFHFAPEETYRDVLLIVDAPDDAVGAERFNVSAHQGGAPLGGVTVVVERGG